MLDSQQITVVTLKARIVFRMKPYGSGLLFLASKTCTVLYGCFAEHPGLSCEYIEHEIIHTVVQNIDTFASYRYLARLPRAF